MRKKILIFSKQSNYYSDFSLFLPVFYILFNVVYPGENLTIYFHRNRISLVEKEQYEKSIRGRSRRDRKPDALFYDSVFRLC